ncbi:MAG: hypothetical protein JJU37_00685 [Balneolaceae bacterium]|nr:hypothetical protein [Balneolaceae bacterium]
MKRTTFEPAKHAFRFENTFKNQVRVFGLSSIPWIGSKFEVETNGLCGGMAFSALDYYHSNRPTPDVTSANATLRNYLLKRQLDSFKYRDSWRFYRWTRRSSNTIVPKTLENEIPIAKESIDKGNPVVLGLVGASRVKDIGNDNHQVVCYGYHEDTSGKTTLYVYDPNCPPSGSFSGELKLIPFTHRSSGGGEDVPGDPSGPVQNLSVTSNTPGYNRFRIKRSDAGKNDSIWRGFFVQRYSKRSNPPVISSTDRDDQRRPVRDHRSDERRDHRDRDSGPRVRDHRKEQAENSGTVRRDHRNQNSGGVNPNPNVRDHQQTN